MNKNLKISMGKEIPTAVAKNIATLYGYDQIIILGLKKSKKPNWYDGWCTTFNKDKYKCSFLGKVANILAHNFRSFYSNEKMTNEYNSKIINS